MKRSIIMYLVLTFLLSSIFYGIFLFANPDFVQEWDIIIAGGMMWMPALSGFITLRLRREDGPALGWQKCGAKYNLFALFIPALYFGLPCLIYGWMVPGSLGSIFRLTGGNTHPINLIVTMTVFAFFIFVTALGEEIGWRGFLLPRLTKLMGEKKAIILSGVIWSAWHFPLLASAGYKPDIPLPFYFTMFTINLILVTVILSILRLRSASLWPAVLLHASHNFVDIVVVDPITPNMDKFWYVGETGLIVTLITGLACVLTWLLFRREKKRSAS